MNYKSFFSELEMFRIKLGLDQTRHLFSCLGNPHKNLRFIHIAGTNGKGSVAAMLSCALTEAGFRTGFYSSPHLISVRERFRIDGVAVSEHKLESLIKKFSPVLESIRSEGISPTYFEVTTALAAAYFAENNVDFVLWETGMGGRFDATNIVVPEVSVITGIDLDHTAHLGTSVAKIAEEKAGIIKKNVPVFCGVLSGDAEKVIRKRADKLNVSVTVSENNLALVKNAITADINFPVDLPDYQKRNMLLAADVLRYLSSNHSFSFDNACAGFAKVCWPGRFQILENGTVIDGAHNPQATKALTDSLKKQFPKEKFSILFAAFADKEIKESLKLLAPLAEEFIFTEIASPRNTYSPEELKKIMRTFTNIPVRKTSTPAEGLKLPIKNRLLATGSLYLAGEVLKELLPEEKILNICNSK